jgi:hypothetical protein
MEPLKFTPPTLKFTTPTLILTRFLYSKDEVELSLLTALLKNEDIQIVYYWAYELYYSGFDVFEFLWKIYLDFYYEQQPYFVTYFKRKHTLWKEDHSMSHLAYILRNMYTLKPSCMVFMMRQYMSKEDTLYPTIIYKFKEGTRWWMQSYEKKYHNLLLALERHHYENICYYLHKISSSSSVNEINVCEINVCEINVNEINVNEIYAVVMRFLGVEVDSTLDNINMHYLLAIIIRTLHFGNKIVSKKTLYVAPKELHLQHILSLEEDIVPLSKHGLPQIYNTLMHKRFVCVDDFVGSFELARFKWSTHEEFIKELYFNWEYYAMGSPIWLKRLEKFGGIINEKDKKIEFLSEGEDGKEGFYEFYAYELDELPKEVQEMSMKQLRNTDGKAWYKYVFQENNLEDSIEALTIDDNDEDDDDDHIWRWRY